MCTKETFIIKVFLSWVNAGVIVFSNYNGRITLLSVALYYKYAVDMFQSSLSFSICNQAMVIADVNMVTLSNAHIIR